MSFWVFIGRSLRFHLRSHLSVAGGAAIGIAVLLGALLVGDSVRESLRSHALQRLGRVEAALDGGDRLFQDTLAGRLQTRLSAQPGSRQPPQLAPLLRLSAAVTRPDQGARANHAWLSGVDERFGLLADQGELLSNIAPGSVVLNEALAAHLQAHKGDTLLLRVAKPSAFSREAALAPKSDAALALRVVVQDIAPAAGLGNLDLNANPTPALNLFVNLHWLQQTLQAPGAANLLLAARIPSLPAFNQALSASWTLEDFQLQLAASPQGLELRSARVFLEEGLVRALPEGEPILTFLANELSHGTRATPYSMVTAAGAPFTPADLKPDELLLSPWLAEDLQAHPGDTITLCSFDPASGARLLERTNHFRVKDILPARAPWADRTLMPDFPGLEKAESTSDWDAGFPLTRHLRAVDERYWKEYRGTPKAFISLAAGQRLWANRFGICTALRFGLAADPAGLTQRILEAERAHSPGFEPVRAQALQAAAQAQDFGQLFLGFSLFLVAAALLLMGLLFRFSLEQRAAEIGTLLALGLTPARVRLLLGVEGGLLALAATLPGIAGGLLYARLMMAGLATCWQAAVGAASLEFHVSLPSLLIGALAGWALAALTLAWSLRQAGRQPVLTLLFENAASPSGPLRRRPRLQFLLGLGALLAALGLVGWALASPRQADADTFFSAGFLLLSGELALAGAGLKQLQSGTSSRPLTLGRLALRQCARRPGRSLAVLGLLASGSFVLIAVSAFHLQTGPETRLRGSGTGGFTWLGETALPVVQDLSTAAGQEFFGLNPQELSGLKVVSLRVHEGEEASCLNLNHAQRPRLLGVPPEELAGRFTLNAAAAGWKPAAGWKLLAPQASEDSPAPLPALGDGSSIEWALGKKLGDTVDYRDEQGHPFQIKLVGSLDNSILQGSLLIDEKAFLKKFPSRSGFNFFLLEAPAGDADRMGALLSRALQDAGLELTPAGQRLETLNAVQNTYLGAFQILGGLGLVLGSAGLGIVVLRNVLERRAELALLLAVGFRKGALQNLLLIEHGLLLVLGLGLGAGAAAAAVLPALLGSAAPLPWKLLTLLLGGVVANGLFWTWLAARWALRGNLIAALRKEN